eukprot:1921547-Prymnesium_polylepis.1
MTITASGISSGGCWRVRRVIDLRCVFVRAQRAAVDGRRRLGAFLLLLPFVLRGKSLRNVTALDTTVPAPAGRARVRSPAP